MRKICVITANRADFSRLESVLSALQKRTDVRVSLIIMGSHLLPEKGATLSEIKRKGFHPDYLIHHTEADGDTPAAMTHSVGLAIVELAKVLEKMKPDIAVVPVDRFESLAMGVTAALSNIHVAHIQGGEVTGTIDESIRHALTKLAHLHFVSTEQSRQRVIRMGESEDSVFLVGCPATDLLLAAPQWNRKHLHEKMQKFLPGALNLSFEQPYILAIQHPVTTEFANASQQAETLVHTLERSGLPCVVLLPNIDAGGGQISAVLKKRVQASKNMHLFAHLPTELFVNLLRYTAVMVGNSSSGIREACYFGTPVVNIGSRQRNRERGSNVIETPVDEEAILKAIRTQIQHGRYAVEPIYGDGTAGAQIAEILCTVSLPPLQKIITY